jgi:hypothetical protein
MCFVSSNHLSCDASFGTQADTCLELMDKPDEDGIKNGKISLLEFMTFMERSDSSVLF